MVNSRQKGKVGEREWAAYLKERGYEARRTQQHKGESDSFDVVANDPVGRWEVKRREVLRPQLDEIVDQARREAAGALSGVAWRRNAGRWVVAMDADDFFRLLDKARAAMGEETT